MSIQHAIEREMRFIRAVLVPGIQIPILRNVINLAERNLLAAASEPTVGFMFWLGAEGEP